MALADSTIERDLGIDGVSGGGVLQPAWARGRKASRGRRGRIAIACRRGRRLPAAPPVTSYAPIPFSPAMSLTGSIDVM